MPIKYSLSIDIDYQDDVDNIHVCLIDNWSGEIIAGGTATKERQAILNCLDYMLREHLPEVKQ